MNAEDAKKLMNKSRVDIANTIVDQLMKVIVSSARKALCMCQVDLDDYTRDSYIVEAVCKKFSILGYNVECRRADSIITIEWGG